MKEDERKGGGSRKRRDGSKPKMKADRRKRDENNFKSSADRPLSWNSYAIRMTCSPDR